MKVRDLIHRLQKLNPEWEILCECSDDVVTPKGKHFRLFDIYDVSLIENERIRLPDGTPYLDLAKSSEPPMVSIDITATF